MRISIEDAVAALRRSGYLLETRIARSLHGFASHLSLNLVFSDPETGQSRELDAYAFRSEASDAHEFFEAAAHLLIECINNPQPIAFFTNASSASSFPVLAARPAWLGAHPIGETLKIEHFLHSLKGPTATNYCTFVSKKKGEWMVTHADEQHREFTTLATLAQLAKEKQLTVLEDLSRPQDAMEWCGINYIFPILVVEGALFDVTENSKGEINIREIDHIRYLKSHIWRGARRYCPIDVVTERFFPTLLKMVQIDCKRTLARMERHADDLIHATKEQAPRNDDPVEDILP